MPYAWDSAQGWKYTVRVDKVQRVSNLERGFKHPVWGNGKGVRATRRPTALPFQLKALMLTMQLLTYTLT